MCSFLKQIGLIPPSCNLSIFAALIILTACNSHETVTPAELSCDSVFKTVHTINLYELSPPVTVITNIVNDSKGQLFFTQYRDPVVGFLDSKGTFLKWIGKAGKGPGEFLSSHIVIDSMDSLIVQDFFLSRLSIYKPGEYLRPSKIINHDKFHGEMIITRATDQFIFQTSPLHHLHMSQDSVLILKMEKYESIGDTILTVNGPDFIVERGDRSVNVLHTADRRNIYFTFQPESFTLFENDMNLVKEYDYDGNMINQLYLSLPPVDDYSKLIELQLSLMGGISGDKLSEHFKNLSEQHNLAGNRALYHEAIKLNDSYYIKLIVNSDESKWLSYTNASGVDSAKIYCHENATLSLKGHNGYYYYGTAFTNDFEQQLFLMVPSDEF
ncbi:MAG: 6-bladed beta-propeller [Rhodothermaceae bacterium]|nr:6-bladed beta-propeller [Rhodothermaceae bacterium]